jgi:hypothetical protein
MRQSDSVKKLQQQQWRVLACGLQTGVWLIAAVVLSRRISGDAGGFATQWAACLVGCVAMAVSVLTTSFLKGDDPRASSAEEGLLPEALSLMPGVMLGLALLPAGSGGGLAALLGLFAVGFGVQYAFSSSRQTGRTQPARRMTGGEAARQRENGPSPWPSPQGGEEASVTSSVAEVENPILESDASIGISEPSAVLQDELPASSHFSPDAQQWMSRSRQDGYDVVEGEVQIDFEAGQRLVALHLPFSPPLAATPEFECEGLDEIELSFRTTARHTYGVRVEVSRSGALDEAATALIGWAASAEVGEEAAAEQPPQSASAA